MLSCCGADAAQVFFSSCNSVKFHAELLNYIDIPVLDIHACALACRNLAHARQGNQKQTKRASTFFEFCNAPKGILLCTDGLARRVVARIHLCSGGAWARHSAGGLDHPVRPAGQPKGTLCDQKSILFDRCIQDYIHRVGRTARGEGASGHALLLLLPEV